jgi:hypothetical protein
MHGELNGIGYTETTYPISKYHPGVLPKELRVIIFFINTDYTLGLFWLEI